MLERSGYARSTNTQASRPLRPTPGGGHTALPSPDSDQYDEAFADKRRWLESCQKWLGEDHVYTPGQLCFLLLSRSLNWWETQHWKN
jgi:hypothetical protein